MAAVPLFVFGVGVNVAVRVKPLPLIADRLPPLTPTSPLVPSQLNVAPGSSENVNVIVALSPLFRLDTLLVIATVGANVSKVNVGVVPPPPLLPAASV